MPPSPSQQSNPTPSATLAPSPRQSAFFSSKTLLAWACALIFAASTLPLYILSLYNHPYYDDFKFSAAVHSAWQETGSFSAVLAAAAKSSQDVYFTWQGNYTGTFLSNLQPGVFGEHLYFLTTFFLLSVFLLCFGFFLYTVFGTVLKRTKAECVILISLTLTLLIQFMPDPGEAFFWFNGGIGNTFVYSLLALSLALCLRLERVKGRLRPALLTAALTLLMVLLGGGSYGGGVFGLLIYALITIFGFVRKSPRRFIYPVLGLLFLLCFLYSMAAPGNGVRSGMLGPRAAPATAILQALYYGIAIAGSHIRLPIIGLTLCLLPILCKAAKSSSCSFSHPWLVLGGGVCLYCAQFVPTLYVGGGVFLGGGRIINTYYQSFVLLWLLQCFYLTGYILRRHAEGKLPLWFRPAQRSRPAQAAQPAILSQPPLPSPLALPTWQRLILTGCCLILVGSLAYKLPSDSAYGLQNLAGPSAALSILRGEAQTYDREMTAREKLLSDSSLPVIELVPLTAVPDLFMEDLLAPEASGNNVLPILANYYGKTVITVKGE